MKAYKVMNYNPKTNKVIAGANNRISTELRKGMTMHMPNPGIYMSTTKEYVLSYYSELAEVEALITFEINPDEIVLGNITDKEPEFTVLNAKVIDFEIIVHEESQD